MGGNVKFDSEKADRIDLNKVDRKEITVKIMSLMDSINSELKLWKVPFDNDIFSGSAKLLFSDIETSELLKHKPTFGDVDILVPKEKAKDVEDFLRKNVNKKIGNYTLIGFKKTAGQIITLWEIGSLNHQLDFEFAPFKNDEPTTWAKFSRSSNWDDVKNGIKGAMHKLLLRAITGKNLTEINIITPAGKGISKKKTSLKAFSVTHGLREKFKKTTVDKPFPIYKSIEVKDSTFKTNPEEIFLDLFDLPNEHKFSEEEKKQFDSFIGVSELIKKYVKGKDERQGIVNAFAYSLWTAGQKLYRDDKKGDWEAKKSAINKLIDVLDVSAPPNVQESINKFYEDY